MTGVPPFSFAMAHDNTVVVDVRTEGLSKRFIGASGTFNIFTLFDSADCSESPLAFVAVTFTEI